MDGTAFGKVILLGEHAVVHGAPALVAALDRGVRATCEPGRTELYVQTGTGPTLMRTDPRTDLGRAFAALCEAAGRGGRVGVQFDLPVRAGLGSSAAFAVAAARALGVDETRVPEVAAQSERVFHGNPSGIDVEAARRGGLGQFSRAAGWQALDCPPFTLCVGLSGKIRSTRELVAGVPKHAPQLDAIATIAGSGRRALSDLPRLGMLMNEAQRHLASLGVSCPELDRLCALALEAGALGAKLTGAGGGGAVIALAPDRERDVLAAWKAAGFDGFTTRIPCSR